jgi:hypothetical protein
MRTLKTILVASVVAVSLYAATGTAWAQSDSGRLGTNWTDVEGPTGWDGPIGVSWEGLDLALDL